MATMVVTGQNKQVFLSMAQQVAVEEQGLQEQTEPLQATLSVAMVVTVFQLGQPGVLQHLLGKTFLELFGSLEVVLAVVVAPVQSRAVLVKVVVVHQAMMEQH
jgi:hypothetical protein